MSFPTIDLNRIYTREELEKQFDGVSVRQLLYKRIGDYAQVMHMTQASTIDAILAHQENPDFNPADFFINKNQHLMPKGEEMFNNKNRATARNAVANNQQPNQNEEEMSTTNTNRTKAQPMRTAAVGRPAGKPAAGRPVGRPAAAPPRAQEDYAEEPENEVAQAQPPVRGRPAGPRPAARAAVQGTERTSTPVTSPTIDLEPIKQALEKINSFMEENLTGIDNTLFVLTGLIQDLYVISYEESGLENRIDELNTAWDESKNG